MQDFWPDSGFKTLTRNEHGWLRVTPDYLRFVLQRPELLPVAESGPRERALHAALLEAPTRSVSEAELSAIEDADARDNMRHFLQLRRALLDAVTLERFYLQTFRRGSVQLPPVFLDMAAHAIVRSLLDGCDDVYQVRAGELLFRRQRISTEGGQVLAADANTIQMFAETGGFGSMGRLLAQQGTPLAKVNMEVMNHETAQRYWLSADRYTWLLDLTHGRAGEQALARVLVNWLGHFLGVSVTIEGMAQVDDTAWRWHVGLDIESSALLNDLYEGREVEAARQQRLINLFRLHFDDPNDMRVDVAGKPVYLGLAMTAENTLKLKPQNLLLNLPLAQSDAASFDDYV